MSYKFNMMSYNGFNTYKRQEKGFPREMTFVLICELRLDLPGRRQEERIREMSQRSLNCRRKGRNLGYGWKDLRRQGV